MKVLYSELKTFLPGLKASPKDVAMAFTFSGLLVDLYREVRVKGEKDVLFGLEVRQNRPDCLGIIGLAREMAVYFKTPLVLPKVKLPEVKSDFNIAVKAPGLVKRASAVQIDNLNNTKPTPKWLAEVLGLHDIKSINFLVDISNYAMLMTGYPNHLFDSSKIVGSITWQRVSKDENFTSLDGTILQFEKNQELVIADNLGSVVLAGSIGGRRTAISTRTTAVTAEVAIYDPKKIREDARKHKVATEASNRQSKKLAVENSKWALEFLINLLVLEGHGRVTSPIVDIYPKDSKLSKTVITWQTHLAEKVGGVPVSPKHAKDILHRLGFEIEENKDAFKVKVPEWRSDVDAPADITEEVLRMIGFQNIKPQKPVLYPLPDITPKIISLISKVKDLSVSLGLDEVLTLPLTTTEGNSLSSQASQYEEVRTQNTINEEFPVLRTNLLQGLLLQQAEYLKRGIEHISIFEVGKVFYKSPKKYIESEHYSALIQSSDTQTALGQLRAHLETILRQLGGGGIYFEPSTNSVKSLETDQIWDVYTGEHHIGFMGIAVPRQLTGNKYISATAITELDLDELLLCLPKEKNKGAHEILNKMAVLDTNIVLQSEHELNTQLKVIKKKYSKNIWSIEIIDSYKELSGSIKFTLRFTYVGLTETTAKKLHKQIFTS